VAILISRVADRVQALNDSEVMHRLQSFRGLAESIISVFAFKDGEDQNIVTQYPR
jgi:hypothetical protein